MATATVRMSDAGWIWQNYEPDRTDGAVPTLRCKRCGVPVFAVTRHAAETHGDDVEVLPTRATAASVQRWTDAYGPDVANGVEGGA